MAVVLLCHCDGTNGSTSFTDSSSYSHALVSPSGLAVVNTAAPKFSTGAADFTAGAAASINTNNSADFNFGTGQFTIEAWAYFTSTPSSVHGVVTKFGGSSNLGWFFGMVNGAFNFHYSTNGSDNNIIGATFAPTLNTWYHLAADRDAANVIRVYVNGSIIASATAAVAFYASSRNCIVGNDENGSRNMPGRLDDVRVNVGVAYYGGAFTPPTTSLGNFTTWSTTDKTANVTISGAALIATATSATGWVRGVDKQIAGKFYWEEKPTVWGSANTGVGFCNSNSAPTTSAEVNYCAVYKSGNIWLNGASTGSTLAARAANDVIGIALDLDARLVWFRVAPSGNWNGNASANPTTGVGGISLASAPLGGGFPVHPVAILGATADAVTANFGDTAFIGTSPGGFISGFPGGLAITAAVVAQTFVDHWAVPNPDVQLTQAFVDHWALPNPQMQITQISLDEWTVPSPAMQLTSIVIEQWAQVNSINTQMVLTSVVIDEWATVATVGIPTDGVLIAAGIGAFNAVGVTVVRPPGGPMISLLM